MKTMKIIQFALFAAVAAFIYTSVQASANDIMADRNNAEKIVREATRVLDENTAKKTEQNFSAAVFENAVGIAVFPGKTRKEPVTGVGKNQGVLLVRHDNDEWSSPLLVRLSYGSMEKRMDGETTDLIFVFENKKVLEELANGKKTDIYAYKGVTELADRSYEGIFLNISEDLTAAYYDHLPGDRKGVRGFYEDNTELYNRILEAGAMTETPESANRIKSALNSYISAKR